MKIRTTYDPPPHRLALRCYLIGDVTPFLTIIRPPEPGCGRWSETARLLAGHFDCDADDIDAREMIDGTELITLRGNVVGSFLRTVELAELLAESAL